MAYPRAVSRVKAIREVGCCGDGFDRSKYDWVTDRGGRDCDRITCGYVDRMPHRDPIRKLVTPGNCAQRRYVESVESVDQL
jgi:hypothetical protein